MVAVVSSSYMLLVLEKTVNLNGVLNTLKIIFKYCDLVRNSWFLNLVKVW